ncbi:reverse transcriptase domain-containing protein [Tanacetum coccineum]
MLSIKQVPRSENKKSDALSKIASTSFVHPSKQVLVEELKEKSVNELEVLTVVEKERDTWMTPVYKYLIEETLPVELRCVRPLQANYVLREIHEGSCSMHAGTRSVVAKALRTGYYWPTMHKDARALIRACQDCQGIDIAGPFLEGPSKVKFLIVAIDYFTKWIEAKPVATIMGNQDNPFKDWCKKLCIRQCFASIKHPQANSNGETPFSLTYETEAVILVEISMPTLRTAKVDMVQNNEALEINLDLLEERREWAVIREAKSVTPH